MTEPIVIENYDPRWPRHFEILRTRIASALGPLAAAIEHVGRTSVPGLAAKPIIDLDVLLHSDADLPHAISALATLGYVHRGNLGIPEREAFQPPPNDFPHHLYVCPPNGKEYRRYLALRDHLRTHSQDAKAYADLKRDLQRKFAADREAYNQAKTEFVEAVLRRAYAPTEHSPGPRRTVI